MYKLYNFEAIFVLFLKTLKLSRKQQKRHLVFFRGFLNWLHFHLKISLSEVSIVSFLPYITAKTLTKYKKFLTQSKIGKTSVNDRLSTLKNFALFLEKHQDLEIKTLSGLENLADLSLLDEFLSELAEKGAGRSTLRSYKSDIFQFLSFLRQNESAQKI